MSIKLHPRSLVSRLSRLDPAAFGCTSHCVKRVDGGGAVRNNRGGAYGHAWQLASFNKDNLFKSKMHVRGWILCLARSILSIEQGKFLLLRFMVGAAIRVASFPSPRTGRSRGRVRSGVGTPPPRTPSPRAHPRRSSTGSCSSPSCVRVGVHDQRSSVHYLCSALYKILCFSENGS